ncbi:MAG: ubiquinol-cytochrome c reductase, cytochrome c1 [Candidatus Xenolissoclinum pacificiensis L6]|uniref:Cytochrome c1 n=1 Tax=Candidatus Xenolissoclinum pacificiensis L6 TaxID=1401685 RepID=W2V333_9RICK|nr:MAG: ubiquinol-cytochrome c reductase, cytochrome c1 [Candidatus Xenolissoclinum pacificiensis L6]
MDLENVGFSENLIKQISSQAMVEDGPDANGEMFERPAIPSDYFVSPYDNDEVAKVANNGALPPDLSLIIKARPKGADYVYSLLTGYASTEPDDLTGLYSNPYFATGALAMTPPLAYGLVDYEDDTEATIENMAYDVVNFLQWVAEPEMEKRKSLGLKVIIFLVVLFFLMLEAKRIIWKDVYKK